MFPIVLQKCWGVRDGQAKIPSSRQRLQRLFPAGCEVPGERSRADSCSTLYGLRVIALLRSAGRARAAERNSAGPASKASAAWLPAAREAAAASVRSERLQAAHRVSGSRVSSDLR